MAPRSYRNSARSLGSTVKSPAGLGAKPRESIFSILSTGNRWQVATILVLFCQTKSDVCPDWTPTSAIQLFLGFQRFPRTDGIRAEDMYRVVASPQITSRRCSVKKLKTLPSHGMNTYRYLELFRASLGIDHPVSYTHLTLPTIYSV